MAVQSEEERAQQDSPDHQAQGCPDDVAGLRQELERLRTQTRAAESLLQSTRFELEVQKSISAALKQDLNLILNSRRWRLTRPLNQVSRALYLLRTWGVAGFARRLLEKLLYRKPRLPFKATALPQAGAEHALDFPHCETPLVSIVIPVFNKSEYTFHCLKTLAATTRELACEVIVVDDCSTDNTAAILQQVRGIRVLRNDSNSGFIASCNRGASAARGEYLLLLNNDTEAQSGWLQALLATFAERPDAGMVGAKLLFADGRLQEAGGIVWQDASAWNYGRNDDPNKPEYSYLRAVDYCSGACLLLKLADFKSLGMFDLRYSPAYYEDTDLAFKVRQSGKQVYYQPAARVVHFEGVSNGTDLNSGIKEFQRINQHKFLERWQQTLATHRLNGQQPELEKERGIHKRVLIIDPLTPTPDRDSGSLRMVSLFRVFQQLGYQCTYYPDNLRYDEHYTVQLQSIGVECIYRPYCNSLQQLLRARGSLFDVVLLSRADCTAKHIDTVRKFCPRAQVLFDTVDLHFLREQRAAEISRSPGQRVAAAQRKAQELELAHKADQTLVVSPVELDIFRQEAPGVKLALLSNIHKVEGRQAGFDERRDILFIGNFMHPPNVDAMHWYIDEVFPLLHKRDPEIRTWIVGAHVPPSLSAKANEWLQFTGFMADTTALFKRVRLSLAPLRYGAGVKGKINSSMSCGVPVVATTLAAEGMGLYQDENVLLADSAEDFAAAIVRGYHDKALWLRLSDAGMENIEAHFSFAVARKQLQAILDDKGAGAAAV